MEEKDTKIFVFFANLTFIQKCIYSWVNTLISKTRHGVLSLDDIGNAPAWLNSEIAVKNLSVNRSEATARKKGWIWIIFKTFQSEILFSLVLALIAESILFIQPFLLRRFLRSLGIEQSTSLIAVTSLLFCLVSRLLVDTYCHGRAFDIAYVCRMGLMGMMYRKSLLFNHQSKKQFSSGKGINTLTSDPSRICITISMMLYLVTIPIRIASAFLFAYIYFGLYSIPAISFVCLVIPVLFFISRILKSKGEKLSSTIDSRMSHTQEALNHMKVVKYLNVEEKCKTAINDVREEELNLLRNINSLSATASAVDFWAPFFATALSVAFAAYYSPNLDSNNVFAFMKAFSSLVAPLLILPSLIGSMIKAKVSFSRIDAIMEAEEIEEVSFSTPDEVSVTICINETTLKWNMDDEFSLCIQNMKIPKGSLVAIIGSSGSGKSTLLHAIIGELIPSKESILQRAGSIGICEQNAWLLHGTVRENIVFGKPYDEQKYRRVIKECSLEKDIKGFERGDATIISDKGGVMSGGQKQRINLARLAYACPDIALLDDPFSAVDSKVSNSLFVNCVKDGALKQSTRLLVTHHMGYLADCDFIVCMEKGKVLAMESYNELMSCQSPDMIRFRNMLRQANDKVDDTIPLEEHDFDPVEEELATLECRDRFREEINRHAGKTALQEYIWAFGGWGAVALVVFFAVASEIAKVTRDAILRNRLNSASNSSPLKFTLIYAGMSTLQGILSVISSLIAVYFCYKASKRLHSQVLDHLMKSKLAAFEKNPPGKILNRFSRDLDFIDTNFPDRFTSTIICFSSIVSVICIIGIYRPIFLLTLVVPMLFSVYLQRKFNHAWRQIGQLSSMTVAPIISHYSESQSGLSTIRAYGRIPSYVQCFNYLTAQMTFVALVLITVRRWTTIRTQLIWIIYWFILAVACTLLNVEPQIVGLILLYVMETIASIDAGIKFSTDLEFCFVAVERFYEYLIGFPAEKGANLFSAQMSKDWPSAGRVTFKNVEVQFNPESAAVIDDFSLDIEPGTHVAVVGRTGAGKSTIISTIFGFVELKNGSILIDGVDLSTLSSYDIRKSLAVVPQEPVLFSGTLRENLDLDGQCTDEEIWKALENMQVAMIVQKLPDKLDTLIKDGGGNYFSNGQKQLLCMARALLKKSKLVILDEATSNLDKETEALIKDRLAFLFKGCTVISVAHRLQTIINFDLVIVMEQGRIVEKGNPRKLASSGGEFSKMVKSASIEL